ncbi:FIG000605: protein co-occurring with transport systems (COG1739) [hydrothermal vent metagenome]|uniref:FIG000605: protein co-occurring with transport systems (COG1739) n=1 Tax=hydrothermal vent metagenome TaxID=652676 RepID=A0A1W1BPE3_9ZZZZ
MFTINKIFNSQTDVKKSKFITYLVPISQYKELRDKLKKDNPKATHIVYALRYLNEYNQIVENSTDDGEPKGCAGLPSLNVLRGKDLINCAVLIVRYFGGIKLGTGGMVRAYALSANDVIKISDIIEYKKMVKYEFETSYHNIEKTNYHLKKLDITSIEREFNINSVKWSIETTQEAIDEVIKYLDFS